MGIFHSTVGPERKYTIFTQLVQDHYMQLYSYIPQDTRPSRDDNTLLF